MLSRYQDRRGLFFLPDFDFALLKQFLAVQETQ
jgi:hypothetical protein